MSYQTKEQSIGYILKASLDNGTNTEKLKTLYFKLNEAIDGHIKYNGKHESIDNYVTYDFMVFSYREIGESDKLIQAVGSYLYYAYDMYTVEEAGEFYNTFKKVLRIKD